jgi:Tol biopolymer transport system component
MRRLSALCVLVLSIAVPAAAQEMKSRVDSMKSTEFQFVSFSPDGKQLVFMQYNHTGVHDVTSELRTINIDGSDAKTIALPPKTLATYPHFSSDGKRIVFEAQSPAPAKGADIWVVNTDGKELTQITANKAYNIRPMFDSAGNIAFLRQSESNLETGLVYDTKAHAEHVVAAESPRLIWIVPDSSGYVVKYLAKWGELWVLGHVSKGKTTPQAIGGLPVKNPQEVDSYRTSSDGHRKLIAVRDESSVPKLVLQDSGKWVEVPGLRARYFDLSPDGSMFAFVAKPSENAKEGIYIYSIDDKQGRVVIADQ